MADEMWSEKGARTAEQLSIADKLCMILNGGTNVTSTIAELRRFAFYRKSLKPAGEPWFFGFLGPSILRNNLPAANPIAQNLYIRDWADYGAGNAWQTPDPTDAALTFSTQDVGYMRNNTGSMAYSLCNLWQLLTGDLVHMLSAHESNADVADLDYLGSSGDLLDLFKTEFAAARAAESSLPAHFDLFCMFQAFTHGSFTPIEWSEKIIELLRYMEDGNALNMINRDTPKLFLDQPNASSQASNYFSGPRSLASIVPNSGLVSMHNMDSVDDIHPLGDDHNRIGERACLSWMAIGGQPSAGPITIRRATAFLAEAYDLAADSDTPPALSTGTLNFNATGDIDTVRFHYESDDGNNIPWHNFDRLSGVFHIYETGTPANELFLTIDDFAVWDDTHPNTPNHAEFAVSIFDDTNWVRPSNGTALTVEYRVKNLGGGTGLAEYYTGGRGSLQFDDDLFLPEMVEDALFSHASNNNSVRLVGFNRYGVLQRQDERVYELQVETVGASGSLDVQAAMYQPENTEMSGVFEVSGYRSDGGAATENFASKRRYVSRRATGASITISQSAEIEKIDGGTASQTLTLVNIFGLIGIGGTGGLGIAAQTWQWNIKVTKRLLV